MYSYVSCAGVQKLLSTAIILYSLWPINRYCIDNMFVLCAMLYYNMLSFAAVYYNGIYILYSRIGEVILGPAESAMPWVNCCL